MAEEPIIRQPKGQPPSRGPQQVVVYRPGDPPPGSGGAEQAGGEGAMPGGGQVGPAQYIYIQTIVPGVAGASGPSPTITHHGPAPSTLGGAYGGQVPPIMAGQPFKPPARQVQVRYGGVAPRYRQRGTSALGAAALMLGIAACVMYWVPSVASATVPIAMVGFAFGVAGAVVAFVFGRSRVGLPMTGVLVCAVAAGIAVAGPDQLRTWWVKARIAAHGIISPPSQSGNTGANSARNSAALHDILVQLDNMVAAADAKLSQEPAPQSGGAMTDTAANGPVSASVNVPANGALAGAVESRAGRASVLSALDRLVAARRNAQEGALASPAVAAAVTAAERARQHLDELRKTALPGSQELRDAANSWMNAVGDAANRLHDAVESDPLVTAARLRYQEAYDAVRGAATTPAVGNAAGE
jgi:hypothetical protein